MSAQLRAEARASGWPHKIVRGLHVRYTPAEGFTAHVHPSHFDEAQDLEYGTPGTRPTYAIRRFSNRLSESEEFLTERIFAHLGGGL
jgi:hypothetical protein